MPTIYLALPATILTVGVSLGKSGELDTISELVGTAKRARD